MKKLSNYILTIFLISVLWSCGPNFYLRKAQRALKKAEQLGANVSLDTVYKTIEVITPKIEFDTVLRQVNFHDTITVEKDNVITKLKINTVTKEIFVHTECPPDTVVVKVPVTVTREIKAGKGFWYYFWRILGIAVLAFIAGYIVRAMAKKQVNINIGKDKNDL